MINRRSFLALLGISPIASKIKAAEEPALPSNVGTGYDDYENRCLQIDDGVAHYSFDAVLDRYYNE